MVSQCRLIHRHTQHCQNSMATWQPAVDTMLRTTARTRSHTVQRCCTTAARGGGLLSPNCCASMVGKERLSATSGSADHTSAQSLAAAATAHEVKADRTKRPPAAHSAAVQINIQAADEHCGRAREGHTTQLRGLPHS